MKKQIKQAGQIIVTVFRILTVTYIWALLIILVVLALAGRDVRITVVDETSSHITQPE